MRGFMGFGRRPRTRVLTEVEEKGIVWTFFRMGWEASDTAINAGNFGADECSDHLRRRFEEAWAEWSRLRGGE